MKQPPKKRTEKEREERLLEKMRRHPELMERLETIVGLAEDEGTERLSADKVEELLIEEVRRLGNRVMQDWAVCAEAATSLEIKASEPGVRPRKKSPEMVVHVWADCRRGAGLAFC